MLLELIHTARDLGRVHEIATVLIRHGFGDVVRRLGLAGVLRRAGRILHWHAADAIGQKTTAQHLREALEELGPTFVKVGQLLAGRPDLLSPTWTDELAALRERVPAAPQDDVLAQLEQDLGAPPQAAFARFEAKPLAAGSIAQVHRAQLADGTEVVLKVRRPGIRDTVDADLRLLARLVELAERELPSLRRYRPRALMRQAARSLRQELDLRLEAGNTERMRRALLESSKFDLVVPRVHDRWTTERLCVLDYIEGVSLGEWLKAGAPGDADPRQLAATGAGALLQMVFELGTFHADPHAGNVILQPDGRLALLDFGMVGCLTTPRREELFEILLGLVERREEAVVDVLLSWSLDGDTDIDQLTADCASFIQRYRDVPLGRLDITAVVRDLAALIRDNDLVLPGDLALLLKVLVTLDGLGRQLDPQFSTAAHLEPFAAGSVRKRFSPLRLRGGLRELLRLASGMPRHTRRLLLQLRRGVLRVDVEVRRLETIGAHLERSANRIAMGMITAALIIGTSIALAVSGGPQVLGMPAFALLGFATSVVAGLWLLGSMLRSGK